MITLVLGGARSGKSAFAEKVAAGLSSALAGCPVTYIATADCEDLEMASRIDRHRRGRPAGWITWEGAPEDLPDAIGGMRGVLLLDCLTMYLSRLMFARFGSEDEEVDAWEEAERDILSAVESVYRNFSSGCGGSLIVVSNEVGLGLVPPYPMGRRFRDLQGRANQLSASYADNAALLVAGLPLWLKGASPETQAAGVR